MIMRKYATREGIHEPRTTVFAPTSRQRCTSPDGNGVRSATIPRSRHRSAPSEFAASAGAWSLEDLRYAVVAPHHPTRLDAPPCSPPPVEQYCSA
jgi:hypothetical protein